MQTTHDPDFPRSFSGGAEQIESPLISGGSQEGKYWDAKNMRHADQEGDAGVLRKIRGEQLKYAQSPSHGVCLASIGCRGHIIEIWSGSPVPFIRIDGIKVLEHATFPCTAAAPPQVQVNENVHGGDLVITSLAYKPMIFSVQDLIDSAATPKYFADFDLSLYILQLGRPADHPKFVRLANAGGGGGIPVGSYVYRFRYSTEDGDRTNWSHPTPPISVPGRVSVHTAGIYPYVGTRSQPANISDRTAYAPKIRFRVNNPFGYTYIEIARSRWNEEQPLDSMPVTEIVGRIPIDPEEFSIKEFIDGLGLPWTLDPAEVLAADEEFGAMSEILGAKTPRFFSSRLYLMNIKYRSKDIEDSGLTFLEIDGKKMFPHLTNIGQAGHADPYQSTYLKHYRGGEKYGWAVGLVDGNGGVSFAKWVDGFENYQMPDRRDEIDTTTDTYSDVGGTHAVTAANVDGAVTKTYEVFDLVGNQKDDECSFKNILNAGAAGKSDTLVNEYCPDAGFGALVDCNEIGYRPLAPTSPTDADFSGHPYWINKEVDTGAAWVDYQPEGFGLNYRSMGMMLAGVDNIPEWAQALVVYRTRPAGRVVCQGIGFYAMESGEGTLTGNKKEKNKWWFYSPDIAAGLVDPADITANVGEYKVEFVSPLGFFSELYDGDTTLFDHEAIDLITYARILKDAGEINPTEAGVGITDYVAYGSWRNGAPSGGNPFAGYAGGGATFDLDYFEAQASGLQGARGGAYYILGVPDNIYDNGTAGPGAHHFNEAGVQGWHEPFYIINIVREGADVQNSDSTKFIPTGSYVKLEAKIGVSTGADNQIFQLVDERWEDCCPALSAGSPFASDDRYLWVKDSSGDWFRWQNVTYKTPLDIAAIVGALSPGEGIYTHLSAGNDVYIKFGPTAGPVTPEYIPAEGVEIYVRYDNTAPVKVYGGDCTVGEAIFSPLDCQYDGSANRQEPDFRFDVGFPFRKYKLNPRYYVVNNVTGLNQIQDDSEITLQWMRQLACMFTAESKVHLPLYYGKQGIAEFFPQTHYVMRPHRWDPGDPTNNIWPEYFEDYPLEHASWNYGGFRFLPAANLDHSQVDLYNVNFQKKAVGYEEREWFPNRIIWSLPRATNMQDSPGIRTFPDLSFYDISDETGQINYAYSALSGSKGNTLYALTEKGICIPLTGRQIITEASGDAVMMAGTGDASGVLQEHWISKSVGLPMENWRGVAEADAALFFYDKETIWMLTDGGTIDILRGMDQNGVRVQMGGGYFPRVNPILREMAEGYTDKRASIVDSRQKEVLFHIRQERVIGDNIVITTNTFSFSLASRRWNGWTTFDPERFTAIGDRTYLHRRGETYEIGIGYTINGLSIDSHVVFPVAPEGSTDKEFLRLRIGASGLPTGTVDILPAAAAASDAVINASSLLSRHGGFEQYIPRKALAPYNRVQGRLIFVRISHNLASDFRLSDVVVKYKKLK